MLMIRQISSKEIHKLKLYGTNFLSERNELWFEPQSCGSCEQDSHFAMDLTISLDPTVACLPAPETAAHNDLQLVVQSPDV